MTGRLLGAVLLCALTASPLACGGGGTEYTPVSDVPTPSVALLHGTYNYAELRASSALDPVYALWGSLTSDGAGGLIRQTWNNDMGGVSGAPRPETVTYTIDSGRRIRFFDAVQTRFAVGRIASAGDVVALAAYPDPALPGLTLLVHWSTGFDPSIVTGTYHGCRLYCWLTTPVNRMAGQAGFWTFDGDGGYAASATRNVEGTIDPASSLGSGTVIVRDMGELSLTTPDGQWQTGQATFDGNLLVLSGGKYYQNDPQMHVLVRSGAGMDDGSVNGPYALVGAWYDTVELEWVSAVGTFQADGSGACTVQVSENRGGDDNVERTWEAHYIVDGTGLWSVTEAGVGGARHMGGVSPDGRYAVFGGGTSSDSAPSLYFLLR